MQKNDISPITASVLLGLVVLAFLGLKSYEAIMTNWPIVLSTVERNQDFLSILAVSLIANIFILNLVAGRILGFKKQGSRLRSIKNDKKLRNIVLLKIAVSPIVSFLLSRVVENYALQNSQSLSSLLSGSFYSLIIDTFSFSLLISIALTVYSLLTILMSMISIFKLGTALPIKTSLANHLTLGSVGEEKNPIDNIARPTWLTIPAKALNGNILVTGSIGSGKTQGTILTYIKQLFSQFDTKPAVLVLDPKGSIIADIVKVLQEKKLLKDVVYLGDANANI